MSNTNQQLTRKLGSETEARKWFADLHRAGIAALPKRSFASLVDFGADEIAAMDGNLRLVRATFADPDAAFEEVRAEGQPPAAA